MSLLQKDLYGYDQFSGIPTLKHAELVEVCVFPVKSSFDKLRMPQFLLSLRISHTFNKIHLQEAH
jgi:hypothetical protein